MSHRGMVGDTLLPRLSRMRAGGVLRELLYSVVGDIYVTVFGGFNIIHGDTSL